MNKAPTSLNCLHSSLTLKWAPLEAFPHKYFDETGKKRWRFTPWPHSREIPDGSLIHPSLRHRLAASPGYQPKNLERNCVEDFSESSFPQRHANIFEKLKRKLRSLPPGNIRRQASAILALGLTALFLTGCARWCVHALK
ncbi:hypothetical protein [Tunturiibacter gelidiferens]|uniref:hypothetical protein n=1 Tax=Tunturiibacter gelidiferens TaxID=3069689 RepID=UPI003D9B3AD3